MFDKASLQMEIFKKNKTKRDVFTTATGVPIWEKSTALTVGPRGPMLMQDVVYLESMAHFNRERVPERVVHAKGAGAHGYFEVTHDITKYCKAKIFSEVGKRTPMFIRFSTVGGESGSADTVRDPRGFAMKFYTEEGNWDLVGNNTPIFFVRDPHLFPDFIHTQKRNPVTHLKDPTMMWDFFTLRPESLHQVMFLYSDRGTPYSFRHMNGYGSHTFKLVNSRSEAVYCKFHVKTAQGIKNFTNEDAKHMTGVDPDFALRDLYNSIENGDFPQWNFFIQVMTFEQAANHRWNPFDLTKVWPHGEFPLIPVGRIVLNRNPTNYFAEVEQAAFAPAHVVPGVEFSPDKMLQGRIFAYMDTQYHRLGVNYNHIPINCPYRVAGVLNTQRDGSMVTTDNQNGTPVYDPNSFNGPQVGGEAYRDHKFSISGDVDRFDATHDCNYEQPAMFWDKVLDEKHRERLVENIMDTLKTTAPHIVMRVFTEFSKVNKDFGHMLRTSYEKLIQEKNSPRL